MQWTDYAIHVDGNVVGPIYARDHRYNFGPNILAFSLTMGRHDLRRSVCLRPVQMGLPPDWDRTLIGRRDIKKWQPLRAAVG